MQIPPAIFSHPVQPNHHKKRKSCKYLKRGRPRLAGLAGAFCEEKE